MGGLRIGFRQRADVIQHSCVNAMHDRVRPPSPVLLGPQAVLIPGSPFEQSVVVRQSREPELALLGKPGIHANVWEEPPAISIELRSWNTGGGAFTSQAMLAGSSNNIATPEVWE